MKYIIRYNRIVLALVLIFTIGSCTKDFEEMNTSPNSPTDVPAINIFTHAVEQTINRHLGGWIQHTYLGCWCQQWCKVQYIDEDRYQPRSNTGDFENPYTGELLDLEIIIRKTTEDIDKDVEVITNTSLKGAATVLKAWVFLQLTDMFGDIPYTEALTGLDPGANITPVYDTQESVYMAILGLLEEGNQLLSGSTVNFGGGDILYGGNPVKWRKFANSLKLRALNRCAGTPWSFTYDMVDPQTDVTTTAGAAAYAGADAAIATILGNSTQYPVFTSNDDNAALYYPGLPYRNPIFNTLFIRKDQAISQTMVNWLIDRSDPRLPVYAQPTAESVGLGSPEYIGQQNGAAGAGPPLATISYLGVDIAFDENAPVYAMTWEEVEFVKAEYYLRSADDANAEAAYLAGVEASMARWGAAYDRATHYTGNALVDWDLAADNDAKFQLICEQHWAGIFGQGIEAWTEVRRTGFPARIFEYELEAAYYPNMGLPIRLQYSTNEETYNATNIEAAKTRQNVEKSNEGMFSTNGITSQMWWHTRKNPIPTETDVAK